MTPYRIETERLVLRCWEPEDAPLLKDAVDRSLDHLLPWMPWAMDEPESLDTVYERLRTFRSEYDRDANWTMGVLTPDDARVLGGTGLHPREGDEGREVGYWIAADAIGKGYATELAGVLTRVAFATLDIDRVVIRVDPVNVRSNRVPEKLGYAKEAMLRRRLPHKQGSDLRDANIWTMFRSELPGSPCEAYGYAAYDALGRVVSTAVRHQIGV